MLRDPNLYTKFHGFSHKLCDLMFTKIFDNDSLLIHQTCSANTPHSLRKKANTTMTFKWETVLTENKRGIKTAFKISIMLFFTK